MGLKLSNTQIFDLYFILSMYFYNNGIYTCCSVLMISIKVSGANNQQYLFPNGCHVIWSNFKLEWIWQLSKIGSSVITLTQYFDMVCVP